MIFHSYVNVYQRLRLASGCGEKRTQRTRISDPRVFVDIFGAFDGYHPGGFCSAGYGRHWYIAVKQLCIFWIYNVYRDCSGYTAIGIIQLFVQDYILNIAL